MVGWRQVFSNNNNVDVVDFLVSLCNHLLDLLMIIIVLTVSIMSWRCCVMFVDNCTFCNVYGSRVQLSANNLSSHYFREWPWHLVVKDSTPSHLRSGSKCADDVATLWCDVGQHAATTGSLVNAQWRLQGKIGHDVIIIQGVTISHSQQLKTGLETILNVQLSESRVNQWVILEWGAFACWYRRPFWSTSGRHPGIFTGRSRWHLCEHRENQLV